MLYTNLLVSFLIPTQLHGSIYSIVSRVQVYTENGVTWVYNITILQSYSLWWAGKDGPSLKGTDAAQLQGMAAIWDCGSNVAMSGNLNFYVKFILFNVGNWFKFLNSTSQTKYVFDQRGLHKDHLPE